MTNPPKFAIWLLNAFCHSEYLEDILGDLDEGFAHNVKTYSIRKAIWIYYQEVFSLIFSYALVKRKKDHSIHTFSKGQNNIPMLKNYFTVAVRSMAKQRLFSLINIIGLSAGMSIGILFITLISFISTYDNFHEKKDQIYRIISYTDNKVKTKRLASSPVPLANLLKQEYSGFDQIIKLNNSLKSEAQFGDKKIPIRGLFSESNFLNIFSFEVIEGHNSLNDPYSILLTESFAKKLFSSQEPIGKIITIGELGAFTVQGILADVPKNSHMWFEALLPHKTLPKITEKGKIETNLTSWQKFHGNYTYMLLPEGTNTQPLEEILNKIAKEKYASIDLFDATFQIQPMSDIALGSDTSNEIGTSWGTEIYLMGLSLTLLILLPACFNYANLSTAKALSRAKEIGMRKVVGGVKKQIFLQFILETVVISIISLSGAYLIFMMIRSEFQSMIVVGATSIDFGITSINLFYSIVFAVFTGVMAGLFPAIHFSKIKPISALKKTTRSELFGKVNFQKSLLVIQFVLSFGFIMGVVVFIDQYRTAMNHDLGFNQENILDINLKGINPEVLNASLNKLSPVQKVSMSSAILGVNSSDQIWLQLKDDSTLVTQQFIDHNYLDNLGLELKIGKGFEKWPRGNEQYVIVNEQFIHNMKFENLESAIGQPVLINDTTELTIIGIVEDFHFQDLSNQIKPLMFRSNANHFNYANAKIITNDVASTIRQIEEEWKKISPNKLEAKFFSDEIDEAFDIYTNVVKIFGFLGFLAITISCLGLLGMVVFSTQNRMKEIGIRKVMGAPVLSITYLLTKSFFKLMIIGSMISIPISYMIFTVLISQQNVYSSGIGVQPVIISLVILMGLGLITVISEIWKAASTNPTETLKYE